MIDQDGHNLAFLLGLPRSGTTLLSVLLDRHPQVLCPPEPWVMLALESFGKVSERHPADSQLIGQAVHEFCNDASPTAANAFAQSVYNRRLEAAGKSIFVDKTPRYYHILPYLRSVFREAKWIWLRRDPFDVAASYKTSWQVNLAEQLTGDNDYPSWSFDLVIGLDRLCHEIDPGDPRVLSIQYEQLAADTQPMLTKVMRFLGREADVGQTQFDVEQSSFAKSFAGDKKITTTHGPHTKSIGSWRQALTRDELQTLLNYVGGETMRQLGYGTTLDELKSMGVNDPGPNAVAEHRSRIAAIYADRWADVTAAARCDVPQPWLKRAKQQLVEQKYQIETMSMELSAGRQSQAALSAELSAARQRESTLSADLSKTRIDAAQLAADLKQTSDQREAAREIAASARKEADEQISQYKLQSIVQQREITDLQTRLRQNRERAMRPIRLWRQISAKAQQLIVGFPHDRRRKSDRPLPTMTVVTPVYNGAAHIRETIESVLQQDYPGLQYIVVDGASTDGTMDIVNEYRDRLSEVISAPDNGMYDAIAKGFERATGEIICYLNADDLFEAGGLRRVGEYFRDHPKTRVLYHEDTVLLDGWLFPNAAQPPRVDRLFVLGGHILFQDGVFFRRADYLRTGGLNRLMRRAGDWDLWVRLGSVARFVRGAAHQSCFRVVTGQLSGDMAAYNAEVAHARGEWRRRFGEKGRPLERVGHLLHRFENFLSRKLTKRRLFFPLTRSGCVGGARPAPGEAPASNQSCRCPLTRDWPDRLLFSSKDTRFGDNLINRVYYNSESDLAIITPALTKERLNELYEQHYSNGNAQIIPAPPGYASPYKSFRGAGLANRLLARAKVPRPLCKGVRWDDQTCEQLIDNLPGLHRDGGPIQFLDVGCFEGRLLTEIAKRTDWKTCGLEPNSKAAEVARKAGHEVWQGFAEDALFVVPPEMTFDVIHLGQTIEHLGDPLTVIRRLRSLLKIGGRIILSTPNLNSRQIDLFGPTWSHWHPPYHRFLFSPKSLRLLAKKADLDVRGIRSYSHPYWTSMSVQLNRMGVAAAVPHTVHFSEDVISEAMSLSFWSRWLWDWRGKGDYLVAVFQKR